MAVVYALLIMKGLKTFAQVPVNLRDAVREYLFSMDLDENGHPLPTPEPLPSTPANETEIQNPEVFVSEDN